MKAASSTVATLLSDGSDGPFRAPGTGIRQDFSPGVLLFSGTRRQAPLFPVLSPGPTSVEPPRATYAAVVSPGAIGTVKVSVPHSSPEHSPAWTMRSSRDHSRLRQ
jgi:hypothetical protein